MTRTALYMFLVMLACSAVRAGAAQPSFEDFLGRVQSASIDITTNAYPDADAVLVDNDVRTLYRADGTSHTVDQDAIKVLTEKGKRRFRTAELSFTLPYSTVEVVRAVLLKPDGTRHEVDVEAHSRVMVDRSQMAKNIFNPNRKIYQVGVPGVEVGDVIAMYSFRDTVKARVPDTWSDYLLFEYDVPIRALDLEVRGPAERPLVHTVLRDEVPGTVATDQWREGSTNVYRWEVRDVPRMFPEPDMPPLYSVVQRLLVSTIPAWEEISRWYWELSAPRLASVTPAMKTAVSNLTAGVQDRQQTIRRLFRFVSQDIRYMGITTEEEAPGYEPHDVHVTFENRYGVCRDKAALLVSMLRLAGLDAYPVLIHNGPLKDPEVPQPFFNHAVVAVAEPAGGYQLMDPTDENTKDLLPAYLAHQSYLVAHPEGERLRVSPVPPATQNLVRIDSRASVDEDGTLDLHSTVRFEGVNDSAYRGFFARRKPEERRRFFETLGQKRIGGASLQSFQLAPADIRNTEEPLTATLHFRAPNYRVDGSRMSFLSPPWLGTSVGYVNFLIGRTGLPERRYPLRTDIACGVEETLEMALPPSSGAPDVLPPPVSRTDSNLVFRRSLHADGASTLTGTNQFFIRTVEFSPDAYLELKETLRDIEVANRHHPLWTERAEPETADSRVLSDVRTVTLRDARHWSSRRQLEREILTYAGAKQYAEATFTYNPSWETVVVHRAAVRTAGGTLQEIKPEEQNLMDASWVGQAPRYPAERTLVLSLPNVQVGSTVLLDVERRVSGKPFFSRIDLFQATDPIRRRVLELNAPTSVPLSVSFSQKPALDVHAVTNDRVRWRIRNAGPLPALRDESREPPRWAFAPAVFSSAGSWREYAETLYARLEELSRPSASVESRMDALLAGGEEYTAGGVARRVRDFVARSIRAAGPSFPALPLDSLSPADVTLAEGYGHQADRAILLAALLRAAGLQPRFRVGAAGASGLDELQAPLYDVPQRPLFDRVLVEIDVDGQPLLLGDTDQYDVLGVTALDGRPGLGNNGAWTSLHAAPGKTNALERSMEIRLRDDGSAHVRWETRYYGTAHGDAHRLYAEMTPEERRRHYRELLGELSQSAEPAADLVTDFTGYPGLRVVQASIDRLAPAIGPARTLEVPLRWASVADLRGEERANPWYRSRPRRMRDEITVLFPSADWTVALAPESWRWEQGGGGMVAQTVEAAPADGNTTGRLTLQREIDLEEHLTQPANVPSLRELQRRIRHPSANRILLAPGGQQAP